MRMGLMAGLLCAVGAPALATETPKAVSKAAAAPSLEQGPSTPPPPVVMVSPRPVREYSAEEALLAPPAVFAIEIMGGGQKVWAGSLRVGRNDSASISMNLSEAPERCAAAAAPSYATRGRADAFRLSLQLYSGRSGTADDQFSINASWMRPGDPCEGGGTLSTGLERMITLAAGNSTVLKADGGLVVKLTRTK